ncbi:YrhB domain-containing protein [Leptospira perdikensis]|uniref:Immunity protein 35 domain-containing protein n=1 Tax=Leptospira perdikensis TaxID=2484948 RepID=A0A4R9JMD6_9LEPT|nr:YrhB domain-containing protein [Leptospira perdikensis]TGL45971.1 hypothetical protein EHQ49_00875 [Leptospira perdikensis]
MKINKEFPISFNIQLNYINEKASIDERLFIKKFNSYFGQFDLKALESILHPYKSGITIGRFSESNAKKIINEYKDLKLKLTERNPTLRNKILIHSENDALQKANDYLNQKSADLEADEYIITKTEVKQYGWLVYFTNKKYVETNDESFLLFGNGPFIINKYDASIYQIGSANPETQIYKYELEYFPDFVGSFEYVQKELTRILGNEEDIFLFDT